MQFQARTFVDFFVVSGYLIGAFALLGAPVKLLLRSLGSNVGRAAPAPTLGLATVILASWYWALPGGGTKPLSWILLAASGAVVATWLVGRIVTGRGLIDLVRAPHVRERAALAAICFAGISCVMIANQTQLFTRDRFTVLSAGNNDAASYAFISQQLLDDGPESPGPIIGYDAGHRSLGFSNGALSALASSASVTGQDVWRVMEPSMFVTLVLGAYATALLLREIFGRLHLVAVGIASVAGFSVIYTGYLVSNWFYAQLLGIMLVTTVTTIIFRAVRSPARKDQLAAVALVGLILAAGLAVYPHMVVMGTIALLPISAVAHDSWSGLARRGISTALVFGAGLLLAVVVAPGLTSDAIDITRELEGVEAGWPLPAIFPTEMLGFQTSVVATQSWITVGASALLLTGLVVLGIVVWRRGLGAKVLPLLVAVAIPVVSYTVVYHREGGPTYRQWKWVTFFIPLFVAATLALVALVAFTWARRPQLGTRVGYSLLVTHVGVTGFVFAAGAGFPLRTPPVEMLSVTPDQIDLGVNPLLDDVDVIHVNTAPYWETMWVAYFLRDKRLSLGPLTYYAVAPPAGDWYLERNDQPVPPGADAIPLNTTYRLTHIPHP